MDRFECKTSNGFLGRVGRGNNGLFCFRESFFKRKQNGRQFSLKTRGNVDICIYVREFPSATRYLKTFVEVLAGDT